MSGEREGAGPQPEGGEALTDGRNSSGEASNQSHKKGCLEALLVTDVLPTTIRNNFWGTHRVESPSDCINHRE